MKNYMLPRKEVSSKRGYIAKFYGVFSCTNIKIFALDSYGRFRLFNVAIPTFYDLT